jgi:FkbM family methyltransferase
MASRLRKFFDQTLPQRRNSKLLRLVDKYAVMFHEAFQNSNPDLNRNGESWVASVLRSEGLQGVFFDVGANVGDWAVMFEGLCAPAAIYCFEPLPPTFAKLNAAVGGRARIRPFNFGLSDAAGRVAFAYDPGHDYFSSAVTDVFATIHGLAYEQVECEVRTGDAFCAEAGVTEIDFLKVDTEGYEGRVLAGFREMLDAGRIRVIQFEYGKANIYSGFLLKDLYAALSERYLVGKIYPNHVALKDYAPEDEDFLGLNYLAVARTETQLIERLRGH